MNNFTYSSLYNFAESVFLKLGFDVSNAQLASKVLLQADLRGIDSHGIARLTGYARLIEIGRVNVRPNVKIIHETPSTAVIDGDSGLGLVVAPKAMQVAIDKALLVGTGWVSVQNSSHFGIAGYHAMMALDHQMIGIAMTNASALVAPTFSKEKMLGTNPIAVAIPAQEQPPFVADFATTTAANGKLELLQRKQQDTPTGWVQDIEGNSSNDANILKKGGALLPLGSDRSHGSHKGYCLGSIVDVLSGVLSGANYGPWVPPFPAYVPMPVNMPGKGIGHFFGAMRIDAFRPAQDFLTDMDNWISRFRQATPIDANNPVLIPGDEERNFEADRKLNGISLHSNVMSDLKSLAEQLSLPFS
jgi:L-2-hydroxycarboxylate dehydrogenase (NAD+)